MSENKTLPPLPEPGYKFDTGGGWLSPTDAFTAEQMHAYGLACRASALEEAAKVADEKATAVRMANTYRGRISSANLWAIEGIENCAAAIRALGKE